MSFQSSVKKTSAEIGEVAKSTMQGVGTGVKIAAGYLPLLIIVAVINRI
jgi:hypothetical protein